MSARSDTAQRIEKDQLALLYAGAWPSVLVTLAVAVVFLYVHGAHAGWATNLPWFMGLFAILMARGWMQRRYARSADGRHWWLPYRAGVAVTGVLWGLAGLLFYPPEVVSLQVFTILVLAGLAAGALPSLAADFPSYAAYSSSALLPVTGLSLAQADELHIGSGILVLALLLFLLRAGRQLNGSILTAIELGYERQALVERLEVERKRLDNRLGRILKDSSAEIYVFEAESLRCLQVNAGAAQNLGYAPEEVVGREVLDFPIGVDRAGFEALVRPLREHRVESVMFEGRHRRRDGSTYDVEAQIQLSAQEEPPVFVATALDVSVRKAHERELLRRATFDTLTGLPNRSYMMSRIDSAFARARRGRTRVAVMFMDLDNFKNINDTLGHRAGDELLVQAANRIRGVLREGDTPSRLSGDEFLVLFEDLHEPHDAEVVARKLVSVFERPFSLAAREIYATTSIGVCLFPDDGTSADEVLQHADTAMYRAKALGRSSYQFFTPEMRAAAEERLAIESHLRRALERGELSLVYQPKVATGSGRVMGAEALLRWHSPELGPVSPGKFITVAEDSGLIEPIGAWALTTACQEALRWQARGGPDLHVAVNVSSRQFRIGRLLAAVDRALAESGLPPGALELEITESLLVQEVPETLETLQALRGRGISLALDDFGTGYSSLSYLKRFPLQVLKIDQAFVRGLGVDPSDEALVEAIVAMAHALGLSVVAEGVERPEQLAFLRARGVDLMQGYLYSRPVAPAALLEMLDEPEGPVSAPASLAPAIP